MKALVYYNPYYPTHIFATVCLWITCKYSSNSFSISMRIFLELYVNELVFLQMGNNAQNTFSILVCVFIASTWHAYTLHVDYKTFIEGVDSRLTEYSTGGSTVFTKVSSKFSVGRLKKKKNQKPRKLLTLITF